MSLLDLVQIHHAVLRETLASTPPGEVDAVTEAASAFLTEVVAPFDLTRQALLDGPSGVRRAE